VVHPGAATRIARPGALLLTLLAVVAALAGCGSGSPDAAAEAGALDANATVVRVVDGDTLVADVGGNEERVRLIGIDTPESVKQGAPVECFGKEASAHAKELLPEGTPVRLVLDVEERDRYERLLAYVYRASDGLFVNLALATDGYAGLLTYPPNVAHTDDFRRAVADARAAGSGLWAACGDDPPVDH
jgi:micrococcal nuclease